jgi:glutamate-1-semialdehyde 2,1-aminomutase
MSGTTIQQPSLEASQLSLEAKMRRRAQEITEHELGVYRSRTKQSLVANARARASLPGGVPSSFQAYDPHPIVAARSFAGRLVDVDGNEYVDFNMGYGALFSGHSHPVLAAALHEQISNGTLFVTPCNDNAEVAELLRERFNLPYWRFTNSGTEATHDAIRAARAFTGRDRIVKVEGGYHGHHDEVMISMKPPLDQAGPADRPTPVLATKGVPVSVVHEVGVVPYNNLAALERELSRGDVACFIVEPAMENIGICLPDPGYLQAMRELTQRHGTLLIFDEVKTGITAGFGGASGHYGVTPDLLCLAKSIGGGLPVGAFGGRTEIMAGIASGQVLHLGTFNGNPLVMAAAKAVLRDICTREAIDVAIANNNAMTDRFDAIIAQHNLPAHTTRLGAKSCVTWSRERVRNYRDYKAGDFVLAYAQWVWGINRGILLPPGLDEQWLVSLLHTQADFDQNVDVFASFSAELTRDLY